jgi:hypothetical protein
MAADEEKRRVREQAAAEKAAKKVEAELQKANKSNSKKRKHANDENTHEDMVIDPPDIPKRPRPQPRPILRPVLGPLEDPMGKSALESQNGDYCKATRAPLVELVTGQYE